MTNSDYNKFLTLLMGGCWHKLIPYCNEEGKFTCELCGTQTEMKYFWNPNPDHLANPLVVIRWMDKEMPEWIDSYVGDTMAQAEWDYERYEIDHRWLIGLNRILDLRNLVDWLYANPAWGECDGTCPDDGKCSNRDCIHPALAFLRGIKEEG